MELLKADVLCRLETSDASSSKSLKSDLYDVSTLEQLVSDRDDFSTQERLKSDRDADHKVLILLASVCRHWRTTIKTRSDLSRQQLCLVLHG